jgi:hypothetical protein
MFGRRMAAATAALVMAGSALAATVGVASADKVNGDNAFLCPVVGLGTLNGPGDFLGASTTDATFLPGKNQAGGHANDDAFNAFGDASATNTPGTAGFTPIWNPPGQ